MTARSNTVRVFVAVGISAEAREQLIGAVERIRQDVPQGIQWANPDGMHLTLKFLGNIPSAGVGPLLDCLDPVATEASPFALASCRPRYVPQPPQASCAVGRSGRRPRCPIQLTAGVGGRHQRAGLSAGAAPLPPSHHPGPPPAQRVRRSIVPHRRGSVCHYPSIPGGLASGVGGCDAERTASFRRAFIPSSAPCPSTSLSHGPLSPLSLRERVRVRV